MKKPVILAVDDDPGVLAAVERDLKRHYQDYRVVSASSGKEALSTLGEMVGRGLDAALLLADQRMPEMTGVQFLSESRNFFPGAARVLLTAYADTEAAIAAINDAGVSHYLLKPWHPPEERLFPVLDDLLNAWEVIHLRTFEGVRLLGERWSPATNQIKDFLARNQVPYQAIEVGGHDGQLLLAIAGGEIPAVFLEDGQVLVNPEIPTLASALGLRKQPELPTYDLVIVGGGPAGLAAAVYATSEGLKTLLAEEEAPGGQAGQSSKIENYLGFPSGLSGADLAHRAVTQARRFGTEMLVPVKATGLSRNDPYRVVQLDGVGEVNCKALLVASGVSYRMLGVEGADRFLGAGIFYGASAVEAQRYQGERVAVVGGGNSASQAALYLAGFAREVYMLVKGDSLDSSMSAYLVKRIESTPNITVILRSQVVAALGDNRLRSVTVETLDGVHQQDVDVSAAFVLIGQQPRTEWLSGLVARDERGFIVTGAEAITMRGFDRWPLARPPYPLETNIPGVFAAGDVRAGSTKRVASATGEGAMAVRFVHQHLETL
ncbi:MAG: FAD-dependent oxidoreductase [Acidimicrobiia bacterium]